MKKIIVTAAATAALAIPSAALASGSGYHENPNASPCGQYHGAFGAFGKDNNWAGGADGQATGDANSAKGCQRNL